ncbi:MAG TPA: glutaminyl-peptide cyclotransferase [Candidatus Hydrogenedens sp.]|nr:glutaminyl-peptide cyclotransferase [Candidatus Hydrogenedens sp.]
MKRYIVFILLNSLLFFSCCDNRKPVEGELPNPPSTSEGQINDEGEGNSIPPQEGEGELPIPSTFWPSQHPFTLTYRIVSKYPHDSSAFTQGLIWDSGVLYESTGLYEQSSIRIVDLETGVPLLTKSLPQEYNGQIFNRVFGEGIAIIDDLLYQITWKEGICFVYSRDKLELQKGFFYNGEGWGLTYDGKYLIMSDGSAYISFREPETFKIVKTILVQDRGIPITQLNELEFIDGYLCANVWYKDFIVVINPETGDVVGKIDLYGLKNQLLNPNQADVLNGVAFRNDNNHLLVTGKYWDTLFEIELLLKDTTR